MVCFRASRTMEKNNKEEEKMIKDVRKSVGLTQKQFSALFEIPIDVVKSWDSGRRKPPEWAEKLIIEKLNSIKETTSQ